MTSALWKDILDQINHKMSLQGRKIILLVDNATVHRSGKDYSNVKIVFLPKNTTALIQPLDQGVIKTLKSYYRTQLVRKMMSAIESGVKMQEFIKKLDGFSAMYMLKRALFLVKPSTVTNCFRKAQIVKEDVLMETDPVEDEPTEVSPTDLSPEAFEQWISCDEDLPCFGEVDEEICQAILENEAENDDNSEEFPEDVSKPVSANEALRALRCLQEYLRVEIPDHETMTFASLETAMEHHVLENGVQKKITDFFSVS